MIWGECPKLCHTGFYTYADQPLTNPPDLTNPICTILSRERFQPDVDYSIFEMSLRLVSRFLALDNVVRHIVIMTDGVKTQLPNSGGLHHIARTAGPQKHPDDHSPDLPEDNDNYYHWRANEILQQAAEHIQFFVNDDHFDHEKGATTRHREGPWTVAQTARLKAVGVGSNIHIGNFYYRSLAANAARNRNGEILSEENKVQKLASEFEFARTIVHELAHALENLYTGWGICEHFCEGNEASERGFDMEAAILGGIVDVGWSRSIMNGRRGEYCVAGQKRKSPHPCLLHYPWPNRLYTWIYERRRLKMGVAQSMAFPDHSCMAHRVPHHFAQSLFLTAYWDAVRNTGQQSLVVTTVEKPWCLRWFSSNNVREQGFQPWLTEAEAKLGIAANQP